MIPLVDLARQFKNIEGEVLEKIKEVLESRSFILGEYVAEFENKFSKLHGSRYCLGCSSGTSALFLALNALGIGEGDEVITVPNTFVATAEAICHTGARPVFVDIDPATYNMNTALLEKAVTEKTKAVLPVHLYGNPVNMDGVQAVAKKHNLFVVEDCAQAHLSDFGGKRVGTMGDAAAFSFFPGKNLGAYGDAGAVITNSKDVEQRVRRLLDHGRSKKYYHEIIGYNERMDGIQAAVLIVKMRYIEEWTKRRRENAKVYDRMLGGNPNITVPVAQENGTHVYHLYVVQVAARQELMEYLVSKGITTSIHYPVPLHLQPALQYLGYGKGDFPVAEAVAEKIVSLPMYPELTGEQVEFICDEINKAVR